MAIYIFFKTRSVLQNEALVPHGCAPAACGMSPLFCVDLLTSLAEGALRYTNSGFDLVGEKNNQNETSF